MGLSRFIVIARGKKTVSSARRKMDFPLRGEKAAAATAAAPAAVTAASAAIAGRKEKRKLIESGRK